MGRMFVLTLLCFFSSNAFCVDIKQVDFNAYVLNNQTVKNYDPSTGRFRGTKSEIIGLEEAKKKVSSIEQQISSLKAKKSEYITSSMLGNDINDNNENWSSIADLDSKLEELNKQLLEANELVENGGVPLEGEIENVIFDIRKQVFEEITQNASSNTILINKLPYYPKDYKTPNLDNKTEGLSSFYANKNEKHLTNYLEIVPQLGYLFPSASDSVLYNRGKE